MNRWHPLPAAAHALVERTPATMLLESRKPCAQPWTRVFTNPVRVLAAWEPAELAGLFEQIEEAARRGLTAAGFFAYECGGCFEPAAGQRAGLIGEPLAWFGLYERGFRFDHSTGQFSDGAPPELAGFADELNDDVAGDGLVAAEFAVDEPRYAERIAAIHEWIRAGDVYQLNFTAPFHVRTAGSQAALYARLAARQPVEFGAFVHWQSGRQLLSFSPELFFRVDSAGNERRITTRPMKGTAPRGRTTGEDRAQAEWLRGDAKNRAENVMIVDLLRNDLGRLCAFGSVQVQDLFAVERYPTLWQMTSTVTGALRPEVRFREILRALFPCGSVTGAPKVRAMQLLAQLEQEPRGVYTGAIGYFSREQTVFNVAIRTLELENGQGRMGAGSGIVMDSDAAAEYRECLLKAEFLTGSASARTEPFELIESLLWRGDYPRLELHLDRLADSAAYFDFACDREAVRAALLDCARAFAAPDARKVRLLLARDGSVCITGELLPVRGDPNRVGRVCMARKRTDSRDPLYFHKTTHRPLYAEAFKEASAAGYDDALFLNERGEVTEGAISNVFVERDGCWLTPPVACGLLAGVERRYLLETLPNARERVLLLDDLRCADAVYVCNAVRGVRRVLVEYA